MILIEPIHMQDLGMNNDRTYGATNKNKGFWATGQRSLGLALL